MATISVSAVCAFLVGSVAGCKEADEVQAKFQESKREIARLSVQQLARETYPQWAASHPDQPCPANLEDLREYSYQRGPFVDPWGRPLEWACGASLPAGARGFAVWSLGPDRKRDTADDIRSWDPPSSPP